MQEYIMETGVSVDADSSFELSLKQVSWKDKSEIIHSYCCFILLISHLPQTSLGYDPGHIICQNACNSESTFSLLSGP